MLDVDGVPRGQPVLDALVELLDLEPLDDNLFRGRSPAESPIRVFGGQVAAQALIACGRTVDPVRRVHSLHAYFVRAGDPRVPIIYQVERVRDGHSFSTRRLVALQHGQIIFLMSSSFQLDEPGIDHGVSMPDVPAPEELPSLAQRLAGAPDAPAFWAKMPRPVDLRYVNDPPYAARGSGPRPGARSQVWFRADGLLPDDDLLHVCVLAYLSDLTLLDSVLATHGLAAGVDDVQVASLDHAMWFHRPVRMDDWVLYDTESPNASGSRGLATGHFFAADGALLVTVVQEGLVRLR